MKVDISLKFMPFFNGTTVTQKLKHGLYVFGKL